MGLLSALQAGKQHLAVSLRWEIGFLVGRYMKGRVLFTLLSILKSTATITIRACLYRVSDALHKTGLSSAKYRQTVKHTIPAAHVFTFTQDEAKRSYKLHTESYPRVCGD